MTYHYSATGERIEDDGMDSVPPNGDQPRKRYDVREYDPEIVARCNDLRRILRESRARRQAVA